MKIQWKLFLYAIFIVGLLFMMTTLEAEATRGVRIELRASEQKNDPIAEEVQLYSSSYALVIGIDEYTQGWPRLSNAIRDAELVADELRNKGFEVTFKKNLNSADLERAFREFFVYKGKDPQARLFVWFAGHGHTQNGEGYLIPADAPLPDAGAEFLIKALPMRRFGEYVRSAQAKHALAVFDSCFSGTIFTTQRSKPPAAVTWATTLPVRQFLSSGDQNQSVSDDGRFRKLFIRALRGEERADANGDGYLTGSELGMFLTDRVTNLTFSRQTPRYGKLLDEDYDQGDFVFLLASSGAVVEKPEAAGIHAVLSVESNVSGARVLVDGREVGSTNLADKEILPGEHRIRVDKEGYEPYRKEIRFAKGRTKLYVVLNQKGSPKGRLYVNTVPEDARIRVLNIKPKFFQSMELEPGSYHIEVSAAGYETEKRWIDLVAGQEEPFSFELEKVAPKIRYTISASSGPNGSISPTGKVVVAQGGRKSFEITPNQGYRIADVEVDGKSVGPKKSYPFNDVSINHTISASFKQRPPYERFAFNPQRRNLQIRSEFLSNPGRQITLEAWFKTEALGTRQAIITKLHPEFKKREPYYQFNLELRQTGQLYFALAIGGKRRWIDNAFLVYPNRWYHVAATYDGKIMRLYLNGEEWGEPYFKEGNLSVYGMPLVIGGESSDRPFKGLLAEVRIWNVTRTKEEIISKMNETIPATSGLVFSSTNQ